MEKQKKINLLALVFSVLALLLQFLGFFSSTAVQSSESNIINFWALQVPICILLIVYITARFKKTQNILYYLIIVGLLFSYLYPFFSSLTLLLRYQYRAGFFTFLLNSCINTTLRLIPFLLIGIYFMTKRQFLWLYRLAFGIFLLITLWNFWSDGKEWISNLTEYFALENNPKIAFGSSIDRLALTINFYGAFLLSTLGKGFLYIALWLSIPKADKNIVKI